MPPVDGTYRYTMCEIHDGRRNELARSQQAALGSGAPHSGNGPFRAHKHQYALPCSAKPSLSRGRRRAPMCCIIPWQTRRWMPRVDLAMHLRCDCQRHAICGDNPPKTKDTSSKGPGVDFQSVCYVPVLEALADRPKKDPFFGRDCCANAAKPAASIHASRDVSAKAREGGRVDPEKPRTVPFLSACALDRALDVAGVVDRLRQGVVEAGFQTPGPRINARPVRQLSLETRVRAPRVGDFQHCSPQFCASLSWPAGQPSIRLPLSTATNSLESERCARSGSYEVTVSVLNYKDLRIDMCYTPLFLKRLTDI